MNWFRQWLSLCVTLRPLRLCVELFVVNVDFIQVSFLRVLAERRARLSSDAGSTTSDSLSAGARASAFQQPACPTKAPIQART